jgi:hypothetical protein
VIAGLLAAAVAASTAAASPSPARTCAQAWNAHSTAAQRSQVAAVGAATVQSIALRRGGAVVCTLIFHYRAGDAAIASEATLGRRAVRWSRLASFPPYMSRGMGGVVYRLAAGGRVRL